jgi:hypothetical protein
MDIQTEQPTNKSKVTRLSLYIGYGDKGRALLGEIQALAGRNGKRVRHLILDALIAKYGPFNSI